MPDQILTFLQELLALPGLSGYESPVSERIQREWDPLVDQIDQSALGSLHARKVGVGKTPRPSLMLAAHMDAIGLMVTEIQAGFLRLTTIGGVDPRILPGLQVIVHGEKTLQGTILQPPSWCLPEGKASQTIPIEHLLVDVGLPENQVKSLVRPGDLVSFGVESVLLNKDQIAGPSLDNRASIAALTICLQDLGAREHCWDVIAAATTQEEEGMAGSYTSAYELRPEIAVAVDVTWARSPGLPEHKTFPIGKGPTVGLGPNIHPGIAQAINKAAKQVEIPVTTEIMPRHSGTDAYALQIAAEGIPTAVVCIPLKYMHTSVEVVSLQDIRRTGRLLAEFAVSLEHDFMQDLSWE